MYETDDDFKILSSDDGQGEVLDKAKEKAVKHMILSNNKTDQRLIDMTRVKYAHQEGVRIEFAGFNLDEDRNGEETEEQIISYRQQVSTRFTPSPM